MVCHLPCYTQPAELTSAGEHYTIIQTWDIIHLWSPTLMGPSIVFWNYSVCQTELSLVLFSGVMTSFVQVSKYSTSLPFACPQNGRYNDRNTSQSYYSMYACPWIPQTLFLCLFTENSLPRPVAAASPALLLHRTIPRLCIRCSLHHLPNLRFFKNSLLHV